jgi:predicted nucleotidyltransferase
MITYQEKQALSDLIAIFKELDLPMILVVAGARLLIFDRKYGEGRSTKDWDVAVSIENWKAYERLRETLINGDSPCFKFTKRSHKFIHISTNIEVDIVPFGKIGEPDQQIFWDDSENSMNVLGFAEANKILIKLIKKFDSDDEKSLGYKLIVLQKGINSRNIKK